MEQRWLNWWNDPTEQPLALVPWCPQSVVVGYDKLGWIGRHLNFDSFSITWPKTVFKKNRLVKCLSWMWIRLCGNTGWHMNKTLFLWTLYVQINTNSWAPRTVHTWAHEESLILTWGTVVCLRPQSLFLFHITCVVWPSCWWVQGQSTLHQQLMVYRHTHYWFAIFCSMLHSCTTCQCVRGISHDSHFPIGWLFSWWHSLSLSLFQ